MLDKLLEFYREDPSDPFNVYALALEYAKRDQSKALTFFRALLKDHPDYLPAYYQAAQFFNDAGFETEADDVYKAGISLATAQRNVKTMQELQRAYRSFLDEQEDF